MSRSWMTRWSKLAVLAAGALALAGFGVAPSYAADDAEIYLVQGLPGKTVDMWVDDEPLAKGLKTAAIAGPYTVKGGQRKLTLRSNGKIVLERTWMVTAKTASDLVLHLPAAPSSDPVVTVFKNDLSAVPKGKASLTVAHTAAVPPADIRVNEEVLFANIANGESLNIVVPVATYNVKIVPTGETGPVILGPLKLTVRGGALNRVYAIGDPAKKTMNVVVHIITMGPSGSSTPDEVNTGTGGQAVGSQPNVFAADAYDVFAGSSR